MFSSLLSKLQLHAPPTTLIVGILAWLFGSKIGGPTLQDIGQIVTLVLGGAALPSAASAVASTAKAAAGKLAGPPAK